MGKNGHRASNSLYIPLTHYPINYFLNQMTGFCA